MESGFSVCCNARVAGDALTSSNCSLLSSLLSLGWSLAPSDVRAGMVLLLVLVVLVRSDMLVVAVT